MCVWGPRWRSRGREGGTGEETTSGQDFAPMQREDVRHVDIPSSSRVFFFFSRCEYARGQFFRFL